MIGKCDFCPKDGVELFGMTLKEGDAELDTKNFCLHCLTLLIHVLRRRWGVTA